MFWGGGHEAENATVSTTPMTSTQWTTANSTDLKAVHYQPVGAATIPVLLTIIVLIVAVGAGVFIYLRIRRRRLETSRRESQIRMSTTNNAGVYVDLSSSAEHDLFTAKKRIPPPLTVHVTPSTEKEHLRKDELD